MFIRRTKYKLAPEFDTERGHAEFRREMRAHLNTMPGRISIEDVPDENGYWAIVAVWQTEADADAAVPKIEAEWQRQAAKVADGPIVEKYGVELRKDL